MDLMLLAAEATEFCSRTARVWQFVGWVLLIFKIVVPILLVIFGMVDLGKAVISSKEDEIKKSTTQLMRRAIAAVVIFFIPTMVAFIWSVVDTTETADGRKVWDYCRICITSPNDGECRSVVSNVSY